MNRFKPALLLALCALLGILLAGCGGGGFDPTPYEGTYHGTCTLDNSKTGDLTVTSDAKGLVSGTLVVTGSDGTDKLYKFTAGSYPVSGSLTSIHGGFEVIGSVPDMGSFFVRGTFPTDGSSKEFKVITGTSTKYTTSQTYTGTLSKV